jgi:hypothetical protein
MPPEGASVPDPAAPPDLAEIAALSDEELRQRLPTMAAMVAMHGDSPEYRDALLSLAEAKHRGWTDPLNRFPQ